MSWRQNKPGTQLDLQTILEPANDVCFQLGIQPPSLKDRGDLGLRYGGIGGCEESRSAARKDLYKVESSSERVRQLIMDTFYRRTDMFKFIGAAVVYGFALYGLATWLQKSDKATDNANSQEKG